jgi:hypothetical protein
MAANDDDGLVLNLVSTKRSVPAAPAAPAAKRQRGSPPGPRPQRPHPPPRATPPIATTSTAKAATHGPAGKKAGHRPVAPTGKVSSLFSGLPPPSVPQPPAAPTAATAPPATVTPAAVRPSNVPLATEDFVRTGLSPSLARLMHDRLGIDRPTAIQAHSACAGPLTYRHSRLPLIDPRALVGV